ncbi:MAG TPA: HD domain-containing phosphohydrolase, partial [Chitinispirillaceae bacterium]|nr:HD domain-containing phosphohydrolase [Chitinispirillaceae bacterium]
YSRELSNIYQHSKAKKKQLAETNAQLVKYASDLHTTITNLKGAHKELQESYRDTIFRLVLASEYKDKDTGGHITRMSRYSILLASKLGLSQSEIDNIGLAAPMHDVGKIGIPDQIILKNGMLTDIEFAVIKTHTTIGALILENSRASILQTARTIALSHHEYWNGKGYPSGVGGDKIPLAARIVALSDTFDALTSRRPYKSPYPIDIACDLIKKDRERHFDPEIVDVFTSNIDQFINIKKEIDDIEPMITSYDFIWSERDVMFPIH